jgi:hypothetical protein
MCPVCIESVGLVVAGVTSTGAVGAFLARNIARIQRRAGTQQPEKETIRHEYESDRAPEDGLAS